MKFKLSDDYIAGFFDGEGSFGFHLTGKASKDRNSEEVRAYISVGSIDKYILELIREHFGFGSIYSSVRAKRNWKPCYAYRVDSYRAIKRILEKIVPKLVIKKKQADLLLEFVELRLEAYKGNPQRRYGIDTRYSNRELAIIREVRKLNRHVHNKMPQQNFEKILRGLPTK
jgi:hypothetical protein